MPQNFIDRDREQELLLPPSLRDWLPDDHLAWFVLDAVDEIDLSAFYGAYREDGCGPGGVRPADDGGAVVVRVRGRGALLTADRAALPRGRRPWRPPQVTGRRGGT